MYIMSDSRYWIQDVSEPLAVQLTLHSKVVHVYYVYMIHVVSTILLPLVLTGITVEVALQFLFPRQSPLLL